MPDSIPILDGLILILLIGALLLLLGIRSSLLRLEARLSHNARSSGAAAKEPDPTPDSQEHNSAFERFLAEDPSRLSLPKSEQAAAYRQWRRDNGMNWSHS